MSIEIIPPGASAVVTERHHDHHHDDQGDRYRNHDRFAEVRRDVKDEGSKGVIATKDARYDIVNEMGKDFRDTGNQLERGFTATAKGFAHIDEEMQEGFCEIKDTVRNASDEASENYCQLQKQISDSVTSTLVGFKDLTALSYQVEGRALLEAAKNANYLAVQADKNANALSVQAQTFASTAQLEAQKSASAAVLQAQQIAAEAARQAAECCCELKELIRSDGDSTRALINDLEKDRLRDKAAKAESQLAAYFARGVAPIVP